jgi:peptidyl-prolyl cis-trans isomerase C
MATLVINHGASPGPATEHPHEHRPAPVNTAPSPEPVVMPPVTVNGVAISRKAIAAEVQNFPAANPGAGWRAATRGLVIRELLRQEALRLAIPVEQEADAAGRLETEEDALIRALLQREVSIPEADDETLRRFYDNNRARFSSEPLFEADHILVAARADDAVSFRTAREKASALASILSDRPDRFAELARDHSACPSAALGGNLGQICRGETTSDFENALVKLAPGEISEPVETRYGIHLIRLRRRIDGRPLPFEAVREKIRAYLEEHVRRRATAQYLSLLVGKADIRGIVLDGASSLLVQ